MRAWGRAREGEEGRKKAGEHLHKLPDREDRGDSDERLSWSEGNGDGKSAWWGSRWGMGEVTHSVDRQSLIQDAGNSEKDPCKERWPRGHALLCLAAKESLSVPRPAIQAAGWPALSSTGPSTGRPLTGRTAGDVPIMQSPSPSQQVTHSSTHHQPMHELSASFLQPFSFWVSQQDTYLFCHVLRVLIGTKNEPI